MRSCFVKERKPLNSLTSSAASWGVERTGGKIKPPGGTCKRLKEGGPVPLNISYLTDLELQQRYGF